ncbi:uncharacterized protein At4g06744-like [Salvia miltiorrhiza]|uniref:uncharacterized protein At4g06744-like n=1 Tax=Salvia miltiorrhiza TaxID=226208 RepID=UPI0025ACC6A2|nr:uncharacterized protein At4g06744-like [Salvia miltiorrhiza]
MRVTSFFMTLQTLFFITTILVFPTHHHHVLAQLIPKKLPITVPEIPLVHDLLVFADQRLAIVYPVIQRFKASITSDPFNVTATWSGGNICRYKGFFCESPPDNRSATAVASIDFNGFRLSSSTLAGFLDQLPDLALFHANSNYFSGPIPPAVAGLPYLYELDLSNNRFSGPFPPAILAMDGLSFLDIRFNSFSGAVPPELFAKDELDLLFLNNNDFTTPFPDNADAAAHVAYLSLANNKFFGPIPRSIATSLAGLSEILLLNNLLSGCLPYELGLLKDAVVFDAGGNNLTGPLPFSLGCLQKLEVLNLAGNILYGQVPEPLCLLGSLRNLSLSDNYFMGAGPSCMRLIQSGVADVRKNCIPGQPLQRSMAECAAFMARPKYCPYSDTYSKIPCWIPYYALAPSPSS